MLGSFTSNCSSGMTITTVPERWDSSWENNLAPARLLDEADIDFMFPVARWVGNGGATNFHGNALDSVTWATGLLAHTQKVYVFATIHAAMHDPVVVAKQLATVDQISDSRIGLNIVAGWNEPEYRAMGLAPGRSRGPIRLRTGVVRRRTAALDPGRPVRLGRRALPSRAGAQRSEAAASSADRQCGRVAGRSRVRHPQRGLSLRLGARSRARGTTMRDSARMRPLTAAR